METINNLVKEILYMLVVSANVLLDFRIKQFRGFAVVFFVNLFQSLFYWTSELNRLREPKFPRRFSVSILVLLDFGIKHGMNNAREENQNVSILVLLDFGIKLIIRDAVAVFVARFNPCFIGLRN